MHLARHASKAPYIVLEYGQRSDGPRFALIACGEVRNGVVCCLLHCRLLNFSYQNTDGVCMSIDRGQCTRIADFLHRCLVVVILAWYFTQVHGFGCCILLWLVLNGVMLALRNEVEKSAFNLYGLDLRKHYSHSLAFCPLVLRYIKISCREQKYDFLRESKELNYEDRRTQLSLVSDTPMYVSRAAQSPVCGPLC
jgi:hypothetical protein